MLVSWALTPETSLGADEVGGVATKTEGDLIEDVGIAEDSLK